MQLHTIQRRNKNRRKLTIGRGGKRGKTSGRGTKGQNARAGRKKRPEMRDIIKKLPKLRGYRFTSIAKRSVAVPLSALATVFPKGGAITPEILAEKGIIRARGGVYPPIKIVGGGDIAAAFSVSGCKVSAGAAEKIRAAKGSIEGTSTHE